MRYIDLWLDLPDGMAHPMQEFFREDDTARYEELVAWNLSGEQDVEYELFYVEADLERYREALEAVESIQSYAIAPIDENSFHLYVCERTRRETTSWREAFMDRTLIVVPPIRVDETGAMGFTLVGEGADIQGMLEEMPEEIGMAIDEIGTYDSRGGALVGVLTDRQREAVAAALERGYYDVPRTASLADVADALGVAQSSASLLLRRAERAVFTTMLARTGRRSRTDDSSVDVG